MENSDQRRQFVGELWRRFEALQEWAILNWPDQQHPLSSANFVEARKEILALGHDEIFKQAEPSAAEPADGGPQYIDVTPAPWP
ncbi:hypothetical protein CSQ96_15995 [Janthinobacterium sp. BJB412]|nr:hypothetical protein CSQ96_15995 [Janthinobacterium sp. BJB412]